MIRAKTWIRHDGTVHESGDVFSAGERDEKRLVALGAAEYVREAEMEAKEPQGGTGDSSKDPGSEEPGKNSEDAEEENSEAGVEVEEGDIPKIPDEEEEVPPSREELEEEYRELGGRPQADWSLEKLMDMLEERRGE